MAAFNERIVRILHKTIFGEVLTTEESAELQEWRTQSPYNEAVWDEVSDPAQRGRALGRLYESDREKLWEKVLQHRRQRIVSFRKVFRYAAAIMLIGGVGTYLWLQRSPQSAPQIVHSQEVLPGSNKAVLTLSDGSTVALDSAGKQVILQGNTNIHQNNGQLFYIPGASGSGISFNTLTTPQGGQFMLTLPDGSRVWLNAASSLRYPTAFNSVDRTVELKGEAYFEVAPATAPFRVRAGQMQVEVLGTHFNVMAYQDEQSIRTTLLQGSVRLSGGGSETVILPGEQGVLHAGADIIQVLPANTEETIAWKNGYFWFSKTDLPTVMRQLSRWYDIEVNYEGKIEDRKLTGKFYRNYNLSQVLSILEANNIHFKTADKKLTVMP
jgi:ferric-dicitrate binding protein FerR (iron transport regulator)